APSQRFARKVDLRYHGQGFEVRVPAPAGPVNDDFRTQVLSSFHDAHEALYGYCYRDDDSRHPVEWVNYRVSGIGPIDRPRLRERPPGNRDASRALTGTRPVHFGEAWTDTPVYERSRLAPGDVIEGPAIIQEFGSTVPLHPGFRAETDPYGNLVVTR
ncbi:hydantoinase/oxoprolinase family protein, partial [Actinomadura adrarensis]